MTLGLPRVHAFELHELSSVPPALRETTRIPEAIARGRARTIINAFHHFTPDLARAILADAVAGSAGVFLSEPFDRNPLRFLSFAPAGLLSLAVNPLLAQRDRAIKAALTWASPVALGACVWDGLVSTLRIYEEADLRAMVAPFGDRFVWEYGRYRYPPMGDGYYFFGVPARARR